MEKIIFSRSELASEVFGIKEETLAKREKFYLEKLPSCTKEGRGSKATYKFVQPPQVMDKLKFQKIFGFKSKRPKAMNAYLSFLSKNAHGFCMTDAEISTAVGEHRPDITAVRLELEKEGFLKPIKEEEKQPFKMNLSDMVMREATKKEWNLYWRTFCYNKFLAEETGVTINPMGDEIKGVNVGAIHLQTAAELDYRVSFKYSRETFFFGLLAALQSYFNYQLFQQAA